MALSTRTWQTKGLEANIKEVLERSHWTIGRKYIDDLEGRGPKRMMLFILGS